MRIEANSNLSSPSKIPWFNNLITEASLDVKTDEPHHIEDKTAPELVDQVNKKLAELGTHIQVKVHDKTNTIMVLVMKDDTNEVIREVPSEKMLDLMYNLSIKVGIFVDEKL